MLVAGYWPGTVPERERERELRSVVESLDPDGSTLVDGVWHFLRKCQCLFTNGAGEC